MLGSLQAKSVTAWPCTSSRRSLGYVYNRLPETRPSAFLSTQRGHSERVVTTWASTEGSAAPAPPQALSDSSPSSSSATTTTTTTGSSEEPPAEEVVFYEGPGSNAELFFSLLLMPTLIYAPLSMASIGRRLWISFKFTNKRMFINNTSPLFKRTIEIAYKNVKEIRAGPRGLGLWGDMVVFLRDGSRIELTGLERYKEIEEHINRCIFTL